MTATIVPENLYQDSIKYEENKNIDFGSMTNKKNKEVAIEDLDESFESLW